jgi:hypothetical protein
MNNYEIEIHVLWYLNNLDSSNSSSIISWYQKIPEMYSCFEI